jgi:uncharacterized lipoprotein YddW (UPF0748 family)
MMAPRFRRLGLGLRVRAAICCALTLCLGPIAIATSPRVTQARRPAGEPAVRAEARVPEVRALWVQRTSLTSPDQIARLVRDARVGGFNTLFVQVRGRGDAYFVQGLEPRPPQLAREPATFDPLAQTLTIAHAAGLRVHAWINVNLIASAIMLPTDPGHVVHKHPEWLMLPRALAPELIKRDPRDPSYVTRLAAWSRSHSSSIEGLYTSPIPADAARYVEAVITDIVDRYPLDGVHLDYVRYPTADFDYSAMAVAAFREAVQADLAPADRARLDARLAREPLIYTDTFPDRWQLYRRARLTDLVARIRLAVKNRRPQAMLTAAVKPDARDALEARLQDWQDWAARGLLDAICPMAYTPDLARFRLAVQGAARAAAPQALWAGIGAYRLDSAETVSHIRAARAAGARGIALFSYDSLSGSELKTIGRAAFGDAAATVASQQMTPLASASTH